LRAWRKEFARIAKRAGIPPRQGAGFADSKKKFAEDIKGEVLQSLVPERRGKARGGAN